MGKLRFVSYSVWDRHLTIASPSQALTLLIIWPTAPSPKPCVLLVALLCGPSGFTRSLAISTRQARSSPELVACKHLEDKSSLWENDSPWRLQGEEKPGRSMSQTLFSMKEFRLSKEEGERLYKSTDTEHYVYQEEVLESSLRLNIQRIFNWRVCWIAW